MMTSSNGIILPVTGPLFGEFPSQRPVTRISVVFFDLGLNKRLIKQSKRWCLETPSHPLWRHWTEINRYHLSRTLSVNLHGIRDCSWCSLEMHYRHVYSSFPGSRGVKFQNDQTTRNTNFGGLGTAPDLIIIRHMWYWNASLNSDPVIRVPGCSSSISCNSWLILPQPELWRCIQGPKVFIFDSMP